MSSTKPSIPKGTRDFTPHEMVRRNYIFSVIRNTFERYGFLPVETPAMENLSTLLGKYGQEGDKLLFRILNSGNFLSGANEESLKERDSQSLSMEICDRGLRYDLTVPFARFVVQHRHEINFPFRRYQIQPVWRADRPQKGRYREFYQCDADVVGSNSLISEAEFIFIMDQVFSEFKIPSTIKINNRKILTGLAELVGLEDRFSELTVLIDKIDKMGMEKITREFEFLGIAENRIRQLKDVLCFHGSTSEKLQYLKELLKNSDSGRKGIEEIEQTLDYVSSHTLINHLEVDNSLARGLDYYTGAIFEVKANNMQMGSICGGGRYDNLTGIFGMPGISGVGISFGAERIYDVLLQEELFPEHTGKTVDLMFVNFGKKEVKYILPLLAKIRKAGINAELYPDDVKMKKQMNYANNHKIPFVALIGEAEIADEIITVKNMESGEQKPYTFDAMIRTISSFKLPER